MKPSCAAFAGFSLSALSALSAPAEGAGPQKGAADLVIRGARVLTMDAARPVATAVAVGHGRILYVGEDEGVAALISERTRVVDGGGQAGGKTGNPTFTVLPGLIDAHAHLLGLGLSLTRLELRGMTSVEAIVAAVGAEAGKRGAGHGGENDWLLGRGWDQNRFPGQALPDHGALDAAVPRRPVWLRRVDGHAGWADAEALRRAGITKDTREPPGGRIVRDKAGEPTGIFIDNAMDLVEKRIPSEGPAELEAAILRAADLVVRRGLTGIHEMGIGPEAVAVYRKLEQEGRLPLRVYAFASDPVPPAIAGSPGSEQYRRFLAGLGAVVGQPHTGPFFTLRGIKLFIDGALGSRGAALLDDYSDAPGNRGLLVSPVEHIEAMARWGRLHGWQITTHAIGDRGNRLVLDAYQRAGVRPEEDLRFRIEHAQIVTPTDQPRFAGLGVIASIQPTHATSDMNWAPARLGPVRITQAYAWQSLLAAGARLCSGSDFPVEEADPRLGLYAAVTRQDDQGLPAEGFYPGQRLSVGEAVRTFTSDAAYAGFAEERLGQVRIGRPADLTVLEGALDLAQKGPPEPRLDRRQVLLTVIDGKVVHDGLGRKAPPTPGGSP